jgi:hypothetical protein
MSDTFEPFKQEKTIMVEITGKEAYVLKYLRQFAFGKFTIHKANGVLVRVESNESKIVDEKEGLGLELKRHNLE